MSTSFWLEPLVELSLPTSLLLKLTAWLIVAWLTHAWLWKANPKWRVLVWRTMVVGLLLIPVCDLLRLATFELPATTAEAVAVELFTVDSGPVAMPVGETRVANAGPRTLPAYEEPGPTVSPFAMVVGLILVGILAGAGRLAIGAWKLRRIVHSAVPASAPVATVFEQVKHEMGVVQSVDLRISSQVRSPCLCGAWRPRLLLPAVMEQDAYRDEWAGVFAHELAHVRAGDVGWNLTLHGVSTLLWFHPLMWYSRAAHAAACETASDITAANYLGSVGDYSRTLLRVALQAYEPQPLSLGMPRRSEVRSRIEQLQSRSFNPELRTSAALAFVVVALVLTSLLGNLAVARAEIPELAEPATTEQRSAAAPSTATRPAEKNDGAEKTNGAESNNGEETTEPEPGDVGADRGPQDDPAAARADWVTPKAELAITRGLDYLASQQRAEGSVGNVSAAGHRMAITAFAGLAFLDSGRHDDEVRLCDKFLIGRAQPDGLLSDGLMYVHAFALQFLAEAQITEPNDDRRSVLEKAVSLTVNCQNERDGWRYSQASRDADSSATACQLVGLLSARRAAVDVPEETVARAVQYLVRCQLETGGFTYTSPGVPQARLPGSAAAMAGVLAAPEPDKDVTTRGMSYLVGESKAAQIGSPHYYYGEYYMSMAMRHAEEDRYRQWYQSRRDQLIAAQAEDGSWSSPMGKEYATAIACIVLQSPTHTVRALKQD